MKRLLLFFSILSSGVALADQVENARELATLPAYCRGTQVIRSISHDPVPIETYIKRYGQAYSHLHHYCWALNSENKAYTILDKQQRNSKLFYALGDIDYVIERSPPTFVLLPEIYTGKARILFKLDRAPEAVGTLYKALQLKPDYWPASIRLSDYYKKQGDIKNARTILEKALEKTPKSKALMKRIAELDAAKK